MRVEFYHTALKEKLNSSDEVCFELGDERTAR